MNDSHDTGGVRVGVVPCNGDGKFYLNPFDCFNASTQNLMMGKPVYTSLAVSSAKKGFKNEAREGADRIAIIIFGEVDANQKGVERDLKQLRTKAGVSTVYTIGYPDELKLKTPPPGKNYIGMEPSAEIADDIAQIICSEYVSVGLRWEIRERGSIIIDISYLLSQNT